ncbi:HlyD family efflux transporter periplasmic adaptor subunit [Wenzhouxiangella sp. AB-CW3]|uniref:efflux RND transporter periplasmic adaptor subunit n=1 Tax=Wenzhouxiangella sp. AB-CW3 TaxID=2771012 RepID=UPI00168B2197|nr:HlyD family efflux transporter periplasmic adaptor subunit [Wenzhouxiangella sp. AB-CW3]QOC22778.1 HlyD family efflux transporter periplasmic adaptor subunit [Wenzhouxiangella sp. AB-CW3]
MSESSDSLFRPAALKARDEGDVELDSILRNGPGWTIWTYRVLVLVLVIAVVYALVARISTYADGQGVVRLGGDSQIVARISGTVDEVRVASGDWVEEGDVLVEFHSQRELDQYILARDNYRDAVQRWLLNHEQAEQVAQARADYRSAQSQLDELKVTAKSAGTVSDVRVRPGQPVVAGQVLLTQGDARGTNVVSLFLPGQLRPQIEPGQQVLLELLGYPQSRLELELEQVDSELIGVEEARGQIGYGLGDSLQLTGTLVHARARILDPVFEYQGRQYPLHDGMLVSGQVQIGSEPVAIALIPGL